MADLPFDEDLLHPDADKLKSPTWDEPGECICGVELPPMKEWTEAGHQWQRVACKSCGRGYVDEDEYLAIYEADYVASKVESEGAW